MLSWSKLLLVSRPRFWIYLLGPYLVGAAAGTNGRIYGHAVLLAIFFLFFTMPANLFVYGVNDIYDYETDRLNDKKAGYETLVSPSERRFLGGAIAFGIFPFVVLAALAAPFACSALAAFLILAFCYSAPPVRAKTRPLLDSACNVLYVCPGLVGYELAGGRFPSISLVVAGGLWTMAMHAYSAVPDIPADRSAGLQTIATKFGYRGTLVLCLLLYLAAALASVDVLHSIAVVLGAVYALLMIVSLARRTSGELLAVYRWFPLVNTASGLLLFFVAALLK